MAFSLPSNPNKGGALVPIGTRGTDLVAEAIDARILRLLGLEDVFDLDYDTYVSLLKERLAAARMTGAKIPVDEDVLLRDEFKRVKGKVGRFKVKSKKIGADSFKSKSPLILRPKQLSLGKKVLTDVSSIKTNIFTNILSSLDNIIKLLEQQNVDAKKSAENDRKSKEREKRAAFESRLEKRFDKVKDIAKKILSPVKSILQKIIDFFLAIFLGRVFYKLVDWLANPENQRKLKNLLRFLKDFAPALLGAYFLFGTKFGRFVKNISGILLRGIAQLVIKNPLVAGGAAAGLATFAAEKFKQKEEKRLIEIESKERQVKPEVVKSELEEAKRSPIGMIGETFSKIGPLGMFSGGGLVSPIFKFAGGGSKPVWNGPGLIRGKKGIDKVPAFVSDGEFVMSRGAVERYGVDTLERMNAAGGGTNKPTYFGGVAHAQGGGLIGNISSAAKFATNVLGQLNPFKSRGLSVGTRATAGFTGMGREGFENILKGQKYIASSKPQILGKGAYSAPTAKGASRYAQSMSSLGGRQSPGGIIKTIVPSNALRLSFIEPQSKVAAEVFDKGKILADKLLQGAYANSALANSLREQMQRGYVFRALTPMASMGRLLGRGIGALNAPVIGDMLFPEPTAAYDQLTGSQAYYNAPGYSGPKPATISTIQSTPPRIVNPPVKRQPKVITVQPQASNVKSPSNPSYQTVPSISAVHADGYSRNAQILGVR